MKIELKWLIDHLLQGHQFRALSLGHNKTRNALVPRLGELQPAGIVEVFKCTQ
jgi:hypothetical protein